MSFKAALERCKCLSLAREVRTGESRYICYTRYCELEERFTIGVSDGQTVWTLACTEKEMKDRCISKDQTSYLTDLSQALHEGEVSVSQSGDTVTLKCGSLDTFTLTEDSGANNLQTLIFHLAHELHSTNSRLKECERSLESTRKQAAADKQVFTDVTMSGPSSKKVIGRPKRTAGASLLNPNSKKRKAATGVVFDTSSTADS